MEVIENIGKSETTQDDLHKLFNIQGHSDYVVVYLRLITSGQLQKEADFYQHFIEGERTISDFCHQVICFFLFLSLQQIKNKLNMICNGY